MKTDSVYCLACVVFMLGDKRKGRKSFLTKDAENCLIRRKMKKHCDNEHHKPAFFDLENCVARFDSSKQTFP